MTLSHNPWAAYPLYPGILVTRGDPLKGLIYLVYNRWGNPWGKQNYLSETRELGGTESESLSKKGQNRAQYKVVGIKHGIRNEIFALSEQG